MIYDTFLFYNELDLLEVRLNTLWNVVDYFVIAESNLTHQKEKKPLFFEDNKERFKKYEQKIIHVIIDDGIECYGDIPPWKYQRNCIARGLKRCGAEDRIILSDLDEIPCPEKILVAKKSSLLTLFRQQLYYYFVDCRSVEHNDLPWSIMFRYGDMSSLQAMRDLVVDIQAKILGGASDGGCKDILLLDNAGWHFSYLGGVDAIIQKIGAFADAEYNLPKFKQREKIYLSILKGVDIYNRELTFEFMNETDYLPRYLRENKDRFINFFRASLAPISAFDKNPYMYSFDSEGDSTAAKIIRMVGKNKRVLELGCASGTMTKVLADNECRVYAVEINAKAAEHAKPYCEKLVIADLDSVDWADLFVGEKFDVILAADVLEHLRDPSSHLVKMSRRLVSGGFMVLSVPNIAHNGVIAELLGEDFRYRETGLLDQTHVHFFSLKSLMRALGEVDLYVTKLERTIVPAIASEFSDAWKALPSWLTSVLSSRREGDVYQYLVKVMPSVDEVNRKKTFIPEIQLIPEIKEINSSIIEAINQISSQRDVLLAGRDAQIAAINKKINEVSTWGKKLHATVVERDADIVALNQRMEAAVAERDAYIVALNQRMEAAVNERDVYIANLNQKAEEVSVWAKSLQAAVVECGTQIAKLNQKISVQDKEIAIQHQKLTDQHAELMKMSDWAYGMKLERDRRNATVAYRAKSFAKRCKAWARRKLKQSIVGDMVRYARDSHGFRKKRVSLEAIHQSVQDNHGRLIVTFPIITWDFRWQRPQHIVSRLRNRGFFVLYVAMSLSPLGRRLRGNKDAVAKLGCNELAPHVNQIWLNSCKQLNIYTDPVEGDDLFNISMGLEALISELHPQSIIYLLQFPGWGPVALDLQKKLGGKIVFDCMDDHGGFSTNTAQALKVEEVLMQNADLVITSSNLLEERAKLINHSTIQVKNGTEFEHFANPFPNGELDHLSDRPIIGYYGAISDWFDMELVAHCAQSRQDWNFVLIGSTFGADLKPVEGMKNIYFLGEKPYKDLPGYLAYFDVCTIPFKIIPLTMATNPVKFYEYLSAGKPVVSVDLPELHAYREDCYLGCNPDEFVALLEQAYNEREDENLIKRRLKLASENSWDARVDAIFEAEIFKTHFNN